MQLLTYTQLENIGYHEERQANTLSIGSAWMEKMDGDLQWKNVQLNEVIEEQKPEVAIKKKLMLKNLPQADKDLFTPCNRFAGMDVTDRNALPRNLFADIDVKGTKAFPRTIKAPKTYAHRILHKSAIPQKPQLHWKHSVYPDTMQPGRMMEESQATIVGTKMDWCKIRSYWDMFANEKMEVKSDLSCMRPAFQEIPFNEKVVLMPPDAKALPSKIAPTESMKQKSSVINALSDKIAQINVQADSEEIWDSDIPDKMLAIEPKRMNILKSSIPDKMLEMLDVIPKKQLIKTAGIELKKPLYEILEVQNAVPTIKKLILPMMTITLDGKPWDRTVKVTELSITYLQECLRNDLGFTAFENDSESRSVWAKKHTFYMRIDGRNFNKDIFDANLKAFENQKRPILHISVLASRLLPRGGQLLGYIRNNGYSTEFDIHAKLYIRTYLTKWYTRNWYGDF